VRHADELRASGADWVVALVHDGVDWRSGPRGYAADPARYTELCRPWAGAVDAIVGTHTLGRWFGSIEGTPVVQPWPFGAELAVVELSSDEEPKTYAIAPEAGADGPEPGERSSRRQRLRYSGISLNRCTRDPGVLRPWRTSSRGFCERPRARTPQLSIW
jgi:hypothetical protein